MPLCFSGAHEKAFHQPEIMYNIYKGEIAFNKNQNKENTLPELAKLNSTIHSLELPILYGYSFVKAGLTAWHFYRSQTGICMET